jgi:hypothetical protein
MPNLCELAMRSYLRWRTKVALADLSAHYLICQLGASESLLFCCCMLQVCFTWVWCSAGICDEPAFQEAMNVVWKLIICLTLFSVAGFIKCSLARLLSYQFYRTAHFQKVKQAIERVRAWFVNSRCFCWLPPKCHCDNEANC